MSAEVRARRDFSPVYVALIGIIPASATIYWTTHHDPQHDTCALASQYVSTDKSNPDISPADRIRLSSAMVRRALECVK